MLARILALVTAVNLYVLRGHILDALAAALHGRASANSWLFVLLAGSGVASVVGLALLKRWGTWAAWLNLVVATSFSICAVPFVLRLLAHGLVRTLATVLINAGFAVLIARALPGGGGAVSRTASRRAA